MSKVAYLLVKRIFHQTGENMVKSRLDVIGLVA